MASTQPGFIEHRWGSRIPCSAPLRMIVLGETSVARLRDLSMSGAFIETALATRIGTPVCLAILREDGSAREQVLEATVVRHGAGGLGVEWCETPTGPVCPVLGCTNLCEAARR
jgi:hypothetical protein